MTLLEMIKKYEKVKDGLEQQVLKYPPNHLSAQIETIDLILKDMKSVVECVSVNTLYTKVLKQIDKAIVNDDPDGALTWTNVLSMLPKEIFPYAK